MAGVAAIWRVGDMRDRFQLRAIARPALNDVPNVAKLFGFNTFHTPQGAFPYLDMESWCPAER